MEATKIIELDEVDSTNKYLKENYNEFDNGTVVSARYQSAGKGRLDRSFVADKDENITLSILLKDEYSYFNFERLSILAGVSLCKTLEKFDFKPSIKWPNDVIIDNKKVAGILLESVSVEKIASLVVGVGLNVNQVIFSDLPNATSLKAVSHKTYDLSTIKSAFLKEFFKEYSAFLMGQNYFMNYAKKHNFLLNKVVDAIINNLKTKVTVLDILSNGHLLVSKNNKLIELNTGEVTFHK